MESWFDKQEDREEGWPRWYDYAKIKKLGGFPEGDKRPFIIQKWHRPLSPERVHTKYQKEVLLLEKGKSLKKILGE